MLDGEYDAEASQASFQAALSQWRQTYQVHTPVSHEESDPNQQSEITITTQTEISKTNEIEIDFGRSYFERLKIMNEIERGVDNLKVDASVDNVSLEGSDDGGSEECEEENEDFRNWDESDQEALDQILLKTSSNPIPILVSNERESKLPVPTWTLTCQDVTKDEEDVIMEALEKGVMVEYIPSSSLAVILS